MERVINFKIRCNNEKIFGWLEQVKILHKMGLENIQVIMLPANEINQLYLDNKKMDISRLNLWFGWKYASSNS